MKFILSLLVCFLSIGLSAQSVTGIWKTIDDTDGAEKSHVELYEVDGKLHGKIIKLLEAAEGNKCISCKGDKKDAPLVGLEIIWNMKNKKGIYSGGKILDPASGKEYKCKKTKRSLRKTFEREYVKAYRNKYLAEKIFNSNKNKILIVYGDAHYTGVWYELYLLDKNYRIDIK